MLVYHLKAAQLSSKCCYLFDFDYIFNGSWVPAAVLLMRSPVLSNALAVPVAGDSHWDYWISRQCGLLDSVLVATVGTGTKMGTGLAGSSLAVLGVTQSIAMAHTSVTTNPYSLRRFLGGIPQTPSLPALILMDFGVFLVRTQLWEDGAV